MFLQTKKKKKVFNQGLLVPSPGSKHCSEGGEGGGVFFEGLQLVPQLHHRLCHHCLFIFILALQIGQCYLCCLQCVQSPLSNKCLVERTLQHHQACEGGAIQFHLIVLKCITRLLQIAYLSSSIQ